VTPTVTSTPNTSVYDGIDQCVPGSSGFCSESTMFGIHNYSKRIQDALESDNILLDLDLFVEETAYHIIGCGDMKDEGQYERYGRLLVSKFPCLEFRGKKTTWV
jgi:hypothetical protein